MVVAHQPEERTLLCLNRRDSDMEWSHCVLASSLRSTSHVPNRPRDGSSWEEDPIRQPRRRISIGNTAGQLCQNRHGERDPSVTVKHQITLSLHQRDRILCTAQLAQSRQHVISFSAHDFSRLSLPAQVCGPSHLTCLEPFRSTSYTWCTWELLGCSGAGPTQFFRERRVSLYLFSLKRQASVTLHSHLPPVSALTVHFGLHGLTVKLEFQQNSVANQYPFLGLFNGSLWPYARRR